MAKGPYFASEHGGNHLKSQEKFNRILKKKLKGRDCRYFMRFRILEIDLEEDFQKDLRGLNS